MSFLKRSQNRDDKRRRTLFIASAEAPRVIPISPQTVARIEAERAQRVAAQGRPATS